MAWCKKTRKPMAAAQKEKPSRVPEGLWVKCPGCAQIIYNKDLATNLHVCPKCAHHFRVRPHVERRARGWARAGMGVGLARPAHMHGHQALQSAPEGEHRSHGAQGR